ncbi:hypothetical protein DACRYDRAFT_101185 [Dacryopinax primogenitus]|uniref:Protein CPL1-like domain-containing protein n=1 Tax=Dacryopinax primogenitus (strain DJM 731) TaxID=1858805 RepID=M5G0X8_DACPD|nr:uncharacterized protein DACRYDRAFT_101185 [Dacryopinax primogenitus]EJT99481.1 hypothetical protein DACRYDRAFT_101185 [Dacryopinax primogenitus]
MYSSLRTAVVLLAASSIIGSSAATSVPKDLLARAASRGETLESIQARDNTNNNNHYCSPGNYWQPFFGTGFCLTCSSGSWCPGGTNAPENDCPAGTANSRQGSTSSTACSTCSAGYYSSSGASDCTKCPNGQTSSPGSSQCYSINSHRPRSLKSRRGGAECKQGFESCPVLSGRGGLECVDVQNDLESCGGCVGYDNEGTGVDCTAISGVSSVQCVAGECVVDSCTRGFKPDASGTSCERIPGLLTQTKRARRQNQSRAAL